MAAIIFDFDGTIADSFDYVADFLATSAKLPPLNEAQRQKLRGMSMIAMARELGFNWWRLPRLFFKGRSLMSNSIKKMKPFEGMPELLHHLHSEGHELFILSTNSLHNLHKFLHQNDLHKYFLEVYGGIGLFSKAPALKKLLKEQNLKAKDSIYVGDELRDIEAAQAARIRVVGVSWGFSNSKSMRQHKPSAIVSTTAELLNILESI